MDLDGGDDAATVDPLVRPATLTLQLPAPTLSPAASGTGVASVDAYAGPHATAHSNGHSHPSLCDARWWNTDTCHDYHRVSTAKDDPNSYLQSAAAGTSPGRPDRRRHGIRHDVGSSSGKSNTGAELPGCEQCLDLSAWWANWRVWQLPRSA